MGGCELGFLARHRDPTTSFRIFYHLSAYLLLRDRQYSTLIHCIIAEWHMGVGRVQVCVQHAKVQGAGIRGANAACSLND